MISLFQSLGRVSSYIQGGYTNEQPEGCPTEIYKIMKKAWSLNPDHRPSFSSVMKMFDKEHATAL
jgi:hypothetical protein